VAHRLKLAANTPVLVLDRLIYNLEGRPVEWRLGRGKFVGKYYLAEFA
jgi:DNA-binding GntR family transcriptional regulator